MNTKMTCLLVAVAALAVGSCTTKNQYSSVEISKLVPPTSMEALDGGSGGGINLECSYLASTPEYAQQQFNVARDFIVGIVVTNNLQNNANTIEGRLNTNDFIAMTAVTTYEATDGSSISISQQTTPTQGLIAAGGVGVVAATLIPAAVAAKLAGVASVRLHTHIEGRLLDGSSVSSEEYLPIAVPTNADFDTSSCVTAQ